MTDPIEEAIREAIDEAEKANGYEYVYMARAIRAAAPILIQAGYRKALDEYRSSEYCGHPNCQDSQGRWIQHGRELAAKDIEGEYLDIESATVRLFARIARGAVRNELHGLPHRWLRRRG